MDIIEKKTQKVMKSINDELLFAYIDGTLDRVTTEALTKALAHEMALQARLEELQQADTWMQSMVGPKAPGNFTHNVMNSLGSAPAPSPSKPFILKGLGILIFGLLSAFCIFLYLPQNNPTGLWSQLLDLWPTSTLPIDGSISPLWSSGALSKGFAFFYAVIVLVLFDRALLQPYFKQRQKRLQEGV